MPEKLLTSITRREAVTTTTRQTFILTTAMKVHIAATLAAHARKMRYLHWKRDQEAKRIAFINTVTRISVIPPLMALPEQKTATNIMSALQSKEEEALRKKLLTLRQIEEPRLERMELLRPEESRLELLERPLHPTAINLIDQEAFCLVEKYLQLNYEPEFTQALRRLIQMCKQREWFVPVMLGHEALQKMVLEQYCTAMAKPPKAVNMMAYRMSEKTYGLTEHEEVVLYNVLSMQAAGLKTCALLTTAMKRKLITKQIASQKTKKKMVPTKGIAGTTTDLSKDDKVGFWQNLFGSDLFFTTLRYAYGMPYMLRRFFARQAGMPENYKYARYFGIGAIPTRRGVWGWKRKRYSKPAWANFTYDMYVKESKRYDKRHRAGY